MFSPSPSISAVHWPPIPFDSFQLCFVNQKRFQEIAPVSFSLLYGKANSCSLYSLPHKNTISKKKPFTDLLVFLIVIWVGYRSGGFGRPGMPTILDRIVKDATVYFMVIFTSHFVLECFILFADVSHRATRPDPVVFRVL